MSASVSHKSVGTGGPENLGVAVGISILSVKDRSYMYFRFVGRHLAFPVSGDVGKSSIIDASDWSLFLA